MTRIDTSLIIIMGMTFIMSCASKNEWTESKNSCQVTANKKEEVCFKNGKEERRPHYLGVYNKVKVQ